MTAPEAPPAPSNDGMRRGLAYVLGATVVAGGLGYVIQVLVPGFLDADEYVGFSVFWSVVYLTVAALSGFQQEVTRASRAAPVGAASGWPVLRRFAAVTVGISVVVAIASAPLWAGRVFGENAVALVAAVATAVLGYTLVAVLSGALYGLQFWPAVAAVTVSDAVLRVIAIVAGLVLGWELVGLGFAVAVPFLLAFVVVWLFAGGRVRRTVHLDAGVGRLLRNSVSTVIAAVATGLMISGLPFLLAVASGGMAASQLASLILVVTLTRAPLVVPLLALQSYLVVTFRDGIHSLRRILLWAGGLLGVTGLLSFIAIAAGPWIIGLLYAGRYQLPPWTYAVIIASAGLTGLLCVTGPAVLAAGSHGAYVAGWLTASAVLLVGLVIPYAPLERALVAMVAAPLVGATVHLVALSRMRRAPGPA